MITALFKQFQGTHRSLELHSWPKRVATSGGGVLGERGPEDLERCPRPVPVDESKVEGRPDAQGDPPGASSGLKGGPTSTGGQACTQPDTVTPPARGGALGTPVDESVGLQSCPHKEPQNHRRKAASQDKLRPRTRSGIKWGCLSGIWKNWGMCKWIDSYNT